MKIILFLTIKFNKHNIMNKFIQVVKLFNGIKMLTFQIYNWNLHNRFQGNN